ncbi:MAG: hypothetical protein LBR08_05325 [Bacteroidales bacterium]|jgi:hypothetical protein|nr:hypothetical protein [Bacteroidales bacterium]
MKTFSQILFAEALPEDTKNLSMAMVFARAYGNFFQNSYKAATCFSICADFYCTHACGGGGTEKTGNPSGTKINPDTPDRFLLSAKISRCTAANFRCKRRSAPTLRTDFRYKRRSAAAQRQTFAASEDQPLPGGKLSLQAKVSRCTATDFCSARRFATALFGRTMVRLCRVLQNFTGFCRFLSYTIINMLN